MTKQFILLLFIFGCLLAVVSSERRTSDLAVAASVASSDYKVQSVGKGSDNKYGYPYRTAPTLTPIQARSDDEDETAVLQAKPYGARISTTANGDAIVKKSQLKKSKIPFTYSSIRRQDDDVSVERRFRSYREPKYRNIDELETDFIPRRMDVDIPYSQYDYSKFRITKPVHSPRDPYLSPSDEPVDTFYPSVPKIKSYSSPYGHGNQGPSYGAGKYDDPYDNIHNGGSYGGSSPSYPSSGGLSSGYQSSGGGPSSYPSSGGPSSSYPSSGGSYDYHGDYAIKTNEPIIGNIRKKLLDYAGASDLYEGEPDYLREVVRNKYKYGNIGNDYYAYGGPGYRDSYRDFPYVESKISLIKKSRRV